MDGWAPIDYSILPPDASQWLADIMNGIEGGMKWPDELEHGKSAFLCKKSERSCELDDYRCLLVLFVFIESELRSDSLHLPRG